MIYAYSIAADTLDGTLDAPALTAELVAAGVAVFGLSLAELDPDALAVEVADGTAKATVDAVVGAHGDTLDEYKEKRAKTIDVRTVELIDLGFSYAGKVFSLSVPAQVKLSGLNQARLEMSLTYPIRWNTIDDLDAYDLQNAVDVNAFYMTALGTVRAHLDSGTALKDAIRAAVDKAGVDAVVDNR